MVHTYGHSNVHVGRSGIELVVVAAVSNVIFSHIGMILIMIICI